MLVSEFHRLIAPEVIGCPIPLIDQTIVQTAFHFCDQTGIWDELSDPVAITAGVDQYEMEFPSMSIALRARDVWVNGYKVSPGQLSIAGAPSFDSANAAGVVTIRPTPVQDGTLQIRTILAPSMNATSLPDALMARYSQAIANGTKASLLLMNGATWANPSLGSYYQKSYDSSVIDTRAESIQDRASGSLYVAPRAFR